MRNGGELCSGASCAWVAYPDALYGYDAGGLPLKLTSGVRVVPDTLPFADEVKPKAAGQ